MDNVKKVWIYSATISFLANNGSIIMSDIEEVREAKSRLKFRTDLTMESKNLLKDVKLEVFKHVLMNDLLTLGIDVIPVVNMMFSVYIFRNRENLSRDIYDYASERVKQINEIEEIKRHSNYEYYISILEENNLESLIDIDSKEKMLSDRELINLIKTHDLDPYTFIGNDILTYKN